MKKRHYEKMLLITCCAFIMFMCSGTIAKATDKGILNNGLCGIYIDIYGSTYTDESNEYKGNAYTKVGCTWFVTARVEELTDKNLGVHSGSNWWNTYYKKYGFTRSDTPRENSIICFSGHVAVLEKIVDGIAYISEGGYSSDDGSHGYCRIHTCKVTEIAEKYKKGGDTLYGYLYFDPIPTMDLNKTNLSLDFGEVAYLEVTSDILSGETVTWTTSDKNIVHVMSNGSLAYLTGVSPGTATITATCGNKVATCKVTVKGDSTEELLTITNDGTSQITETSARIKATISPGMIIEEAGFYYGTSKTSLTQKKESVNSYTTTIWYDLGTGKWTSALKPNTTYYYQLYVKVNGQTYKTAISSFKTAQGETYTLTNAAVSKLTTTSARIKATISPGVKIESAGFYYGKSSSNLTKKTETINAYAETAYYDLGTGKWCSALTPNTTYYYQLFIVVNGTEYKSPLAKFTTAKNKLVENSDKYTSLSVSDITETSAKIRAEYPKALYDDAGFYFGKIGDLASMKKTSEYVHGGTPSTSYVNSYKLGVKYDGYGYKWSDPLEAGTKYYYAFYLVLDGTEYVSAIKSFTTSGTASLTNVEMTSYPSKRDYVVGEKIDTTGVKLKVTYSNGKTATITSGVTVSGNASSAGTKQITLKYEGYSFKYNVNVTQPLTSIQLSKTSATLDVYDVLTLNVTYNPTNTTDNKDVTWKSSNTNVVTVDNGLIIAVGGGSATVTATCGSKTTTCKITVRVPVTGVILNKTSAILTSKGETVSLQATVAPSNAANKNVTWLSSDTSVAKVNSNGIVTAVGEGITTVSVTTESGQLSAICVITVDYPESEQPTEPDGPQSSEKPTEPDEPQSSEKPSESDKPQSSEKPSESDKPQSSEEPSEPDGPQDSEEPSEPDEPQNSESSSETEGPGLPEKPSEPQEPSTDFEPEGNFVIEREEIPVEDMEILVEVNSGQSIEITNEDGVVFKFVAGSMHIVEGIESYDFSTDLKVNIAGEDNSPFDKENCVLQINYGHSGELPGTAIISIPVGVEWAGRQLYYYQVFEDGSYKYTGESAVVDADGRFTICQNHCSDYVISAIPPVNLDKSIDSNIFYVIGAFMIVGILGAGIGILLGKRRSIK